MTSNMPQLPLIGLMLGDATGIGPEISVKVLASGAMDGVARLVVIGDVRVLRARMRDARVSHFLTRLLTLDEVAWPSDSIPVVDLANLDPARLRARSDLRRIRPRVRRHAEVMIDLALDGRDSTASASRRSTRRRCIEADGTFHDEHQMFAKLTNHDGFFGEMNVIPGVRDVSRHVARGAA